MTVELVLIASWVINHGLLFAHWQRKYPNIAKESIAGDFWFSIIFSSIPFIGIGFALFNSRKFSGFKFLPVHDEFWKQVKSHTDENNDLHSDSGAAVHRKSLFHQDITPRFFINGYDITADVNKWMKANDIKLKGYFGSYRFDKNDVLLFRLKFL